MSRTARVLKRIAITIAAAGVLLGGAGFWLMQRPGAAHKPVAMLKLFAAEQVVENFRTMSRIFPYRAFTSSALPRPFPEALLPLPEGYRIGADERATEALLDKTKTTALLAVRDGVLIHEVYRLGASRTTQHTSWSVAKSFVGTLIGIALKEGRIKSLDDRAEAYVPALKGSAYGRARILDLLMMASGVRFDETYADRWSDINVLFYRVFIFGSGIDGLMPSYSAEAEPGTVFRYKSSETHVLTQILRAVYGRTLAALMAEKIWTPLGMEAPAYWSTDADGGTEIGFCCLNATARDYAKLGQLYLDDGIVAGVRLLPEGFAARALEPNAAWQQPGANPSGDPRGYGRHFWIPPGADQEAYASGVWGQMIWIDRKTRTVVVKMAADRNYREHQIEVNALARRIARPPQ